MGFLRALLAVIPQLLDRRHDDLQGLERIDRLLVETENEQLPPVPDLSRVSFNLAENILSGLRGEIHNDG
jgi:hypothetical protein